MVTVIQIVSPPQADGMVGVTGPERRAANLIGQWREFGVDPVVCYPRRGNLWPAFEAAQVPLIDFEIGTKFNFAAIGTIERIARTHRADVIHTQGPPSLDLLAMLAAQRCGIGTIITRPVMIELESAYSRPKRMLYTLIDKLLTLRRADCVIAVSDEGARHLRDQLDVAPRRLRRIHNGIDMARFSARQPSAGDGSSSAPPVVLGMIGHLLPYKGWPDFIEIIAALRRRGLNVKAVALGEGNQRRELEELVRARNLGDAFEFRGFQSDVRSALQEIDIFLIPSLREGLSVAIIEAMASGLPVVASDVGGVREQVEEGANGHVLAVHDIEGMAAACVPLIGDPKLRAAMGRRSRELAQERFSERRMLEEYVACYREVAAAHDAAGAAKAA